MKKLIATMAVSILSGASFAQSWPTSNPEAKAGARWWWLGSAVSEADLRWNMQEYSKAGIGELEITPLYKKKRKTSCQVHIIT